MAFEDDFDTLILSPNCKPRTPANANVVAICIHDEEYPEIASAAEDVGRFFQNKNRQASTTGVIDNDSSVGCVPYGMTAWHSGAGDPWNYMIEGYEHSGYAKQTREEWLDPYGIEMLERSAKHVAKRCVELGIPIRKIDAAQLRLAIQTNDPSIGGLCGHIEITQAAGIAGGHWDPGPNFPWDYYIERVQYYADGNAPVIPTPPVKDPVVHTTNSGSFPAWPGFSAQTLMVQQYLNELGINAGPEDGIFGSMTENAVIQFQNRALDTDGNHLVVDGIVGPKTWASLQVCVYLKRIGENIVAPTPTDYIPALPYNVSYGYQNDTVVKKVQQRLRDRGWTIGVDGTFGTETDWVVKAFQKEKGLVSDGIVGPATWNELFRTDNIT